MVVIVRLLRTKLSAYSAITLSATGLMSQICLVSHKMHPFPLLRVEEFFFVAACCGDELVNGKSEMLDIFIIYIQVGFHFLRQSKVYILACCILHMVHLRGEKPRAFNLCMR